MHLKLDTLNINIVLKILTTLMREVDNHTIKEGEFNTSFLTIDRSS